MASTDREWVKWGRVDPYFGVLTAPRFRNDRIAENRDEFFQTGVDYVARHLSDIEAELGPFPHRRALDFGCGVGRIAIPLAAKFDKVLGLDISPGMIEEARRNARNSYRLSFALSDDHLTNAQGTFDFVHSYIVLQHIPVSRGLTLIRRLLDKVEVGGVASIHVGLPAQGSRIAQGLNWLRANVPGLNVVANLSRGRPIGDPTMQMNGYPLDGVLALFAHRGFSTPIVRIEDHNGCPTAQIFAKRSV